jgi:hypothetical protein
MTRMGKDHVGSLSEGYSAVEGSPIIYLPAQAHVIGDRFGPGISKTGMADSRR